MLFNIVMMAMFFLNTDILFSEVAYILEALSKEAYN